MSALTTYLLALPDITYLGNTDVAAGTTTLTDLTGTFAAGTEINAGVSRNGFGATGFVTGHATCWQSSATEARGFQIATAATAALQLQTLTLGVFVKQTSAVNSPVPLLGRQNGIYIGTSSARHALVAVTGGGVTAPSRTNPTTFTLSTGHLIGATYDGQEMQPWVDGVREGFRQRLTGPFTTFLNRVAFGGDTGSLGAGTLACLPFIIAGRTLDADEWRTIYELGLGATTADDQACYDYVVDSIPEVAATTTGLRCRGCGGQRRVAEGGVKEATAESHTACFGGRGFWFPTATSALGSSPTDRELDSHALRFAEGVIDSYTTRPTTDKPWYLATTGQLSGSGITTQTYGGLLSALGALHHYTGGGPYSSYLQRMKLVMTYLRTNRVAVGLTKAGYFSTNGTFSGEFSVNGVFTCFEMLPGLIAVWGSLDADTRAEWLDTMRTQVDAEWAWEQASYWSNGNIVMHQWGIYAMMAYLDPVQVTKWQTYADTYWEYLFAPTGGSGYAGNTLTGVGVRQFVDGTPTNDTLLTPAAFAGLDSATDKVYATEGNTGATAPGSTVGTYGRDWNYTAGQAQIALRVYQVTGNTDALKFAEMAANTVQPRHNLTNGSVTGPSGSAVPAWYSDYRGGTRHNAAEPGHYYLLHALRREGRTDLLTGAQQAGHELWLENDAVLNTTTQNVWYRIAGEIAMFLWKSPYWPTVVI